MTAVEVRSAVKNKYQIPSANTDFDDEIDECVEYAVSSLEPYVQKVYPEDTTVTVASSTDNFTLPTAGTTVHRLQIRPVGSTVWLNTKDYTQVGDVVYLQEAFSGTIEVRLFVQGEYALTDIDDIPTRFQTALVSFSCAEFATVLAGQKTKYNLYQQVNGARSVSSMADLAQFYEARGERSAERVADPEGLI